MLYNFRIDKNKREEIIERLKVKSALSQGWGGGPEGGLSLSKDNFRKKVKNRYDLKTTRIPTNLTKIEGFRDSDIIVTPHLPKNGTFSIHVVDGDYPGSYEYIESDKNHLNHTIKVKASYGLNGNLSLYNKQVASWKGKLQWLGLPIIPINQFKADFVELINELKEDPKKEFVKSTIHDYLDKLQTKTQKYIASELQEISASGGEINFESICELILNEQGYETNKRHQYDGKGGDIDLICINDRTNISPFEQGESVLFVQIKKHTGTTKKRAIEQLLKMMDQDSDSNGCVMTLADKFSDDAIELAEENGIVLIDGNTISELMMSVMVDKI